MAEQALAGGKVLDLSHYVAGPYCTRILAGFGADVLKIAKPGEGDLGAEPHRGAALINSLDQAGRSLYTSMTDWGHIQAQTAHAVQFSGRRNSGTT